VHWLISGADNHLSEVELFGLFDLLLVLEDDLSAGWKGEVVFLIAGSTEPEMLDGLLSVIAGDDSDYAAVAEVVELSSAVRVEATVDHRTLSFRLWDAPKGLRSGLEQFSQFCGFDFFAQDAAEGSTS
jgi:hypothetical protein